MSKILVIEDDDNIRSNVLDLLEAEGLDGIGAADGQSGIALAVRQLPELIICDVMMPDVDGYQVLEVLSQRAETAVIPFIFLSARAERADIRKGMSLGADDYLTKPFTRSELLDAIRARLQRWSQRNQETASAVDSPATRAPGFVAETVTMRELLTQIERVAKSSISVLILGETGVGKEMVAEYLHRASGRKGRFVAINCAALSETLLESELFGHEKGAFTGAISTKEGLFESAHGGTLFLDEVGDMPLSTQVKLLRVLETKTVTRVGARSARPVDVRFVSATHRNIDSSLARGTTREDSFRDDLYFRLDGITLRVPPLRERDADIEALALHFMELNCRALRRERRPQLSAAARTALLAHHWPGNIRELRNVIERAVLTCDAALIEPEHLCLAPQPSSVFPDPLVQPSIAVDPRARLMNELSHMEKQRIVEALSRCAGNQTVAAELLGISRRTLVTRLQAYDLPRPRRRN